MTAGCIHRGRFDGLCPITARHIFSSSCKFPCPNPGVYISVSRSVSRMIVSATGAINRLPSTFTSSLNEHPTRRPGAGEKTSDNFSQSKGIRARRFSLSPGLVFALSAPLRVHLTMLADTVGASVPCVTAWMNPPLATEERLRLGSAHFPRRDESVLLLIRNAHSPCWFHGLASSAHVNACLADIVPRTRIRGPAFTVFHISFRDNFSSCHPAARELISFRCAAGLNDCRGRTVDSESGGE